MENIIRQLPDRVANQIAAGEVVQRPASVVKELMENAVDAGASQISLIIKEAGRQLIQVVDNGKGMSAADALMAFSRHATSKIAEADDLFKIRTMGFRGEALASIASVAQVELRTKQGDAEFGTLVQIEGSEVKKNEPTQTQQGTNLAVRNLFFNIPARRNFLKTNAVERTHILNEFTRVAMAWPDRAFHFHDQDHPVYQLRPGKLATRIVELLGPGYKEQLAPCEIETTLVNVQGYIGKPSLAKKSRTDQFLFVNKRFVKHYYFHQIILQAFEGLLPADSHPFYVLFLEVDPQLIDINIHPTKTEIKFDYEKEIAAILRSTVRGSLKHYNLMPTLDFDRAMGFTAIEPTKSQTDGGHHTPQRMTILGSKVNQPQSESDRVAANQRNWPSLYGPGLGQAVAPSREQMIDRFLTEQPQEPGEGRVPLMSAVSSLANSSQKPQWTSSEREVIQVALRYVCISSEGRMIAVDQKAAHERILYEKLRASMGQAGQGSQGMLFPSLVHLSPAQYHRIIRWQEAFAEADFFFESFGDNCIKITGLPLDLPKGVEESVMLEMLEQIEDSPTTAMNLTFRDRLAKTLAQRGAIPWGKSLSLREMQDLVDQLFACEAADYSPTGLKTWIGVSAEQLAIFFKS